MSRDRTYNDFDIVIEPAGEARYRARVIGSPAGEATGTFELPFSDLELENFLLKVGRPRRGTRRLDSPEMGAARTFGGRLFGALFHDDLQLCLRRSLDEVERVDQGLRIRLRLGDAPELATLPWEYLFNESSDRFLVLSTWTPIVRYVDLAQRIEPLTVHGPLRILALISSPRDYPALDVEDEWQKVESSLTELMERGLVSIDRIEDATLLELQRKLRQAEYHVFHFVGHGGFDEQAGDGVLVFEDGQERSRRVSGADLGTILHDHRSLRLAVLNACEGARTSGSDPFSGTAQSLIRQGVPAVVAMQFEITDDAAIAFAHEFYAAVVDGLPVDASIGEARRAIFGLGNDIEWGTPVLYMRTDDGRLFDVTSAPDVDQPATAEIDQPATAEIDAPAPPVDEGESADEPVPAAQEVVTPAAEAITRAPSDQSIRDVDAAVDADSASVTPPSEAPDPDTRIVPDSVAAAPADTADRSHDAPPASPPPRKDTPEAEPGPTAGAHPARAGGSIPLAGWIGIGAVAVVLLFFVLTSLGGGGSIEPTTTSEGQTTTSAATTTTVVAPDATAAAAFTATPKTIDGIGTDWAEPLVHTTPHAIFTNSQIENGAVARLGTDAAAIVRLAWDDAFLYILAEVEDDVRSNPNSGNQIWHGDAVDLNLAVIGSDGTVSERPDEDDHQLTLSPGDPAAGTAPGSVRFVGSGTGFADNFVDIATVAVTNRPTGYTLEARIPWNEVGVSRPSEGDAFRLLVAVFDNDGEIGDFVPGRRGTLQTRIMANTPNAEFQGPATWGTFVLESE